MFSVKDILNSTDGRLLSGNEGEVLMGVSTDTRRLKAGELFVAIKGQRFDGHNFILDAISRGAAGILVQDGYSARPGTFSSPISVISVADTVKSLGDIARFHRMRFNIDAIGITGSNGKTTTKEMAAAILSRRFSVLKNFGTENNHIGVPITLMRLNASHRIAVVEMGANHAGEIRRLSDIVRPTIGVITNIGPSHLEYFDNLKAVLRAKSEMLEFIREDKGFLVLNGDDENLSRIKTRLKVITFGLNKKFDFFADRVNLEPDGISFKLNGRWHVETGLVGRHNVYNALAAIAVAWDFGVTIEDIREALKEFRMPNMRMEVKRLKNIKIINDTYNSNPLSMKQAIEALRDMTTDGRKILVAGDMLELGNLASRFHHIVGRQAAESGIDYLVAVGKLAEHIARGAQEAGMSQKKIKMYNIPKEACEEIMRLVKKGDTVLVKGSRGMKMEEIVNGLEEQFK